MLVFRLETIPTSDSMAMVTGPALDDRFASDATLADRLEQAARTGRGGLVHVRASGEEVRQSYGELLDEALRIATGLRAAGVAPGDFVLLQLERSEDFIAGLWGCIVAGAVPAPVAVAPTFSHATSALQKLLNAARLLERCAVLATGAALDGLRTLSPKLGAPDWSVLDLEALRAHPAAPAPMPRTASDVAVLLLTSGSTGQPKGVPLTHRNLLAMAAGTIQACGFDETEVTLNWMALDHAGAVSFLGTMAVELGCTQIHVPTGYILQDPLRWLDLIDRHRATISWAPNFAFSLLLDRAETLARRTWDLRCMRFLVNAGEPVVARTARNFIRLLQRHGLPVDALRPAFGMSETCSGITWSRGFTLEHTTDEQSFVDLGPCIAGAEMRIVDDQGAVLRDGETGLLQLRGPSLFSGYYRNAAENAEVFRDGWFTTGDLAYLRSGCLHISGRRKDVIIINGVNFHCHEIESVAEQVAGVRKTFTAACSVRAAEAQTDQLALFFSPESGDRAALEPIARAIRSKLIQEAGVPPAFVLALPPAELPKTEIGKIQRAKLKQAFESGAYRDRIVAFGRPAPRGQPAAARSRGDLAAAIARIWQEVLGLESVGYDDTFFELGGHSLLVVQVQARLQELIGRPVPVVELFNCPTVRTMAAHFAAEAGRGEMPAPARSPATPDGASRDIAIIGLGLRFPGASSPAEFWRLLAEEREAIHFFTAEDALRAGVRPEVVRDPNYVKAAPMLEAPDAFDAEFFRYSAKEARLIDPQQRVFLEVCWEAFEDAGYDPTGYAGKVGVFAAAGLNTYLANHLLANRAFLEEENGGRMLTVDSMSGFNIMITNDKDYLPTRVSYKLNLRGPSVNVQTACSSTLLTLHQACNALRLGDCTMALAGGVSIKLPQHAGHLYSAGMLNSPDGHCRAYDEKAEGTIFGNGAGAVLLKPLAAAVADGDHIYAVVKATASNNDGAGKVGFTAPSASGEEDVCAEALARAGVDAGTITFLEGHGTGTPLGDPIEVDALARAFARQTPDKGYCALGSVKTNVGHLQIASGIAGLIKTALALRHRQIPGTLHFEKPNPRIDFAQTPFFVNRHTMPWQPRGGPRRAGVNSLGIGGTNVHAILEEPPDRAPARADPGRFLLPLSARHPAALRQLARRYADFLRATPECSLADVAYTAQVGRAPLPWRAAFVGESREELWQQLDAFAAAQDEMAPAIDFEQHGLAFVFSDDAEAMAGVAGQLHADEPVFRAALERCVAALDAATGTAMLHLLISAPAKSANGHAIADGGEIRAAALFAFEYALAEWLGSYGVEATRVVGRGIGEIVVAVRAGSLSLADGLGRVLASARWSAKARGAADTSANGQHRVAPLEAETRTEANLSEFAMSVELGATPAVREGMKSIGAREEREPDLLGMLAKLFSRGYPIRWTEGRRARPARRVPLPTYPWQHRSYWIEGSDLLAAPPTGVAPGDETPPDPLLGRRWRSPRIRETVYETQFDLERLPWLTEHRVHDRMVAPAALFLAQVSAQANDLLRGTHPDGDATIVALSEVLFVTALVVEPTQPRTVQTVFTPENEDGAGGFRFEVVSFRVDAPDDVSVHATGRVQAETGSTISSDVVPRAASTGGTRAVADHYAVMEAMQVELGPSFRCVREIHAADGWAEVRLEPRARGEWHPGLVDSVLQAAVPAHALDGTRTLIPFRVERLVLGAGPASAPLFARAVRHLANGAEAAIRTDIRVVDAAGRICAEVAGFELRELTQLPAAPASASELVCLRTEWEPLDLAATSTDATARGAWLLLMDDSEICRKVRRSLEAARAPVTVVAASDRSTAERHLQAGAWRGVIYGWSAGVTAPDEIRWSDLLACVRAAANRTEGNPPRWVILADGDRGNPAQAPFAGFVAGLAHEFPEWRPLHVQIETNAELSANGLARLTERDAHESRVAVRSIGVFGARLERVPGGERRVEIRPDASYLVTGGSGALGQAVVDWLIAQGARNLVLGGRRPPGAALEQRIAAWTAAGAQIACVMTDVADAAAVDGLVARAEALAPLRGVFHAAGTLHDGLLRNAQVETFTSVFAAKIRGAWNLHAATAGRPLDCFVLFSSIAAVLGSPAQANYAAANAFLDGLAAHRRARGLPGSSIQWGPWEGAGMTARLADRDRQRLLDRGLVPMAPAEALRAMARALATDEACVAVFGWSPRRYRASLGAIVPALYRRLFSAASIAQLGVPPAERSRRSKTAEFSLLPLAPRAEAIERLIREAVAAVLGLASPAEVDREKSLFEIGLDSLTAVDVKIRLEQSLGTTLRATIAFDYPTAATMAAHLAQSLFPESEKAPPSAPPTTGTARDAGQLGDLSASDLAALLAEELER